jgi:hypothetical protein
VKYFAQLTISTYSKRVKIESYCEMSTKQFVGEGDIERISLSGKFRRARMA